MDILEKIVNRKKEEVKENKSLYPAKLLERSIHFEAPTLSMTDYLRDPDKNGIIAEFKKRSPSQGPIHPYAKAEYITVGYMQAGCSGLSVLTDVTFFGGSNEDLKKARQYNYCPVLRKDFIIDEYQIVEAKSIGADVILLIGECLSSPEVTRLASFAKSLNLQVLYEVHSADMLKKLTPDIDIVGVNNRNLKNFKVDVQTSLDLAHQIPTEFARISESGIEAVEEIQRLREAGFDGFLIGTFFMSQPDPAKACAFFADQIKSVNVMR